jgi:hypothetical protein
MLVQLNYDHSGQGRDLETPGPDRARSEPMPYASAKRFVIAAIVVILGFGTLLPLVNLIVDPFRAFGMPEIPGLTDIKPMSTHRSRLSKAYSVCAKRPDLVFLGGSRAEFLYDPRYPALSTMSHVPYNLALPGIGVFEIEMMLRHAYFASGRLKHAYISLDFLMFNAYRELYSLKSEIADFDPDHLVLSPKDNCLRAYSRYADILLFSMPALEASWTTLRTRHFDEIYWPDGLRHSFYNTLAMSLRTETTQRIRFANYEVMYLDRVWLPPPWHRYCFESDNGLSTVRALRQIVKFARDHGIELVFVLTPEHARLLAAIKEIGLQSSYEQWKRIVVEVVAEDAAARGVPEFPIYDFSTVNAITAEAVPASGLSRMFYWYEGSHGNVTVGRMVLDRVLEKDTQNDLPANFGMKLVKNNIDTHLAQSREALRAYEDSHLADVADIKEEARQFRYIPVDPSTCPQAKEALAVSSSGNSGAMNYP